MPATSLPGISDDGLVDFGGLMLGFSHIRAAFFRAVDDGRRLLDILICYEAHLSESDFLEYVKVFLELLAGLMVIGSGVPCRGSELVTLKLCHLRFQRDCLEVALDYNKSRHVFYPLQISQLMFYYVDRVRPRLQEIYVLLHCIFHDKKLKSEWMFSKAAKYEKCKAFH